MRRSSNAPVSRSDPKTVVHSSKGRLVVTRMEPRSYRWLKTSKSSSAAVGDRGTKPSSSMISRLRRDNCRWRLSSSISSRVSSGPLYLVFTCATPQRGSPAKEAARAYSGDMTTWSVSGGTSPRASLSM